MSPTSIFASYLNSYLAGTIWRFSKSVYLVFFLISWRPLHNVVLFIPFDNDPEITCIVLKFILLSSGKILLNILFASFQMGIVIATSLVGWLLAWLLTNFQLYWHAAVEGNVDIFTGWDWKCKLKICIYIE